MKTVSKKIIANRTAAREKDACRYAAAISAIAPQTAVEYAEDAKGRKVRMSAPCDAEIAYALRGNRVIDTVELREMIGEAAIGKLIANGSLERDPNHNKRAEYNTYWITEKAADIYGIPATWTVAGLGTFKLQPAKR